MHPMEKMLGEKRRGKKERSSKERMKVPPLQKNAKRTAKIAKLGGAPKVAGSAPHAFPVIFSMLLCRATQISWPSGGWEME